MTRSTWLCGMAAALFLFADSASAANVRFVTPVHGAQVLGVTTLEVATDATEIDRVEFYVDGALVGVVRKPPYRFAHDFGVSLLAHHIVAHVRSQRFQRNDVAEVRTAAVGGETITVNLVEVPLRAHAERPVTAKDLSIVEDGVRQTVRDVFRERPPTRFVFLLDRSDSMGDGKLLNALMAVDEALRLLRPDDTAQIIFFNHNFGQLEDLPRTASARSLYASIEPSGGTSLRDAVVSTVKQERTITIAVTDGSDRNSEVSNEDALRRVSGTNSLFFALVFDDASRFLEAAARNTGGEVTTVSTGSVRGAMRDLMQEINSRYLVVYQSSGRKKGWRAIKISGRNGVNVVKARKGYFAE
ncbi:MAG TPA: Ig-like domain-containing protein [Thermoanaerobaculia bacterium]